MTDILTLDEAADLMQVDPDKLRSEARAGKVPHCRLGREFRFSRAALLAYAAGSWMRHPESTAAQTAKAGGPPTPTPAAKRLAARVGLR